MDGRAAGNRDGAAGRPLIQVIGGFRAVINGQAVAAPPNRRVAELLTYLLLMRGNSALRRTAIELLYGSDDELQFNGALRNVISVTQRWLRDALQTPHLLTVTQSTLHIDRDAVDVDVLLIEQAVSRVSRHRHRTPAGCSECRQQLAVVTELLSSDRPAAAPAAAAAPFRDWYSDRLHELLVDCTTAFTALIDGAPHQPEQQLRLAQQWQQIDPTNEQAQRRMLESLARLGRRADALQLAARFTALLQAQFGIEPDSETRRLINLIAAGQPISAPRSVITPPPTMIGRDRERLQLQALVRSGTQRLITISGVGGVGKTTLARSAAADLLNDFTDGVLFLDLSGAADRNAFTGALAAALQLRPEPTADALAAAAAALNRRDLLLILDNTEQIRGGAEAIAALLEQAPQLHLLVTSRRPLQLRNEYRIELQGLSELPPTAGELSPALSMLHESLRHNAVDISRDDILTYGSLIVHACDGLPLAIELVADQARFRALSAIADDIVQQPGMLTAPGADRPPHRRSLLIVIEQTLALLPAEEQLVIAAMTLFSGPFELRQLQQSTRQLTTEDHTRQAWQAAVDLGLLRRVDDHRFRMHALIRRLIGQYHPAAAVEADALRSGYVRALLEPLIDTAFTFVNEQALTWIERNRHLLPDLRNAWQLADVDTDADLLRRAALPLSVIAYGANWVIGCDELLSATIAHLPDDTDNALLRRLHGIRLLLGLYHRETPRISASVERLLREPLPQPLQPEHQLALWHRALQAINHQQPAAAWAAIERSRSAVSNDELPLSSREPLILHQYYRTVGDQPAALRCLYDALRAAHRLGDRRTELAAHNGLALIAARAGDLAAALPLFHNALMTARAIGDSGVLPSLLANSARARNMLYGPHADSAAELAEALTIARRYGMNYELRVVLGASLTALPPHSPPDASISLLQELLLIDCSIGLRSESIDYGLLLADALVAAGRPETAVLLLDELIRQPICSPAQATTIRTRAQQLCGLPLEAPPDPAALDGLRAVLQQLLPGR